MFQRMGFHIVWPPVNCEKQMMQISWMPQSLFLLFLCQYKWHNMKFMTETLSMCDRHFVFFFFVYGNIFYEATEEILSRYYWGWFGRFKRFEESWLHLSNWSKSVDYEKYECDTHIVFWQTVWFRLNSVNSYNFMKFCEFFSKFYEVLPSFIKFYEVSWSFNQFCNVLYAVLWSCMKFYECYMTNVFEIVLAWARRNSWNVRAGTYTVPA